MRRPKPSPDALAAALEAAQRLAAEADAEQAADDTAQELTERFQRPSFAVCADTAIGEGTSSAACAGWP